MAVDDPDTIDIMSIAPSGAVVLTIADHLDWIESTSHQYILQAKMNRYLAFIESGEILEHHPDANERGVIIDVVIKYEPDADGLAFLQRAHTVVVGAGVGFNHRVAAEPVPSRNATSKPTGANVSSRRAAAKQARITAKVIGSTSDATLSERLRTGA